MTRGDRILIAALICASLLVWPLAAARADSQGGQAYITGPGGRSVISLSRDAEYRIDGAMGEVVVRVVDGSVRVHESGCPDQTCVRTGAVSSAGSVIACVPNRVVIRVGGEADDGFDARVR
ncbi:MAG: NusG domain II-containing protein [Coriobacteriia bacterium]|nr:NusG domain II-containing protein [Coriobacteriia bacterium]MBN2840733.1 NusG domain II-containing protein [Coriobacteriia bacterium]